MCNPNVYKKPKIISISRKVYRDILNQTYAGIIKKLESAMTLLNIDEHVSAGLYTYALEELGKILLLKQSIQTEGEVQIEYCNKFTNHKAKFGPAFDYLQQNGHGQCIILNSGGFDPNGFDWRGFDIGLLSNFEARLSIFYSDLKYNNNGIAEIKEIPPVERGTLRKAIDELKVAMLNEVKLDD